jgi:transposase
MRARWRRSWSGVDIIGAPSALLLALLAQAGQSVRYASGRVVAAMSAAYTGEGKTDAKDAYVIAETARLRRDLAVIDADTDLVRNLAVLTGHRADLIADRVRMINRMRDLMTSVFPGLERAFDYSAHKGALVLLTGYATPDRIRRMGESRLANWLRQRNVRGSADVAARAITAAKAQTVVLPGQELTANITAELAGAILALDERVKALDTQIEETFAKYPQAAIIQSMPGFGPFLGASLLVGAGDLRAFPSAGHVVQWAGRRSSSWRVGSRGEIPMRYALLVCGDENQVLSEQEQQERLDAFMSFQAEMDARSKLVSLHRLRPTSSATTVKVREGGLVIADGPFAETKEQVAGFYVLECSDLDEAIELAAQNPAARFGTI